ncbi:MAG: hypothetical protein KDC92_13685 [Bacteroidetes bacterium]|nr:hypothetical protein [Bacteroidota bacterium]
MKNGIWSLLILFATSSCTLKQTYDFNSDFSGKHVVEVDMSAMTGLMEGENEMHLLDSMGSDTLIDQLNAEPGISNTFMTEENGLLKIGYDFSGLEAINNTQSGKAMADALNSGMALTESTKPLFVLKGKKLIYNPPAFDNSDFGDEMESFEGMGDMLQYEVVMHFAKPIKKIDNDDWRLSSDNKTISLTSSISELRNGNSGAFTLKFK